MSKHRGYVYRADDGRLFMVRCPECGKENYAAAVSGGICVWCGCYAKDEHLEEGSKEQA